MDQINRAPNHGYSTNANAPNAPSMRSNPPAAPSAYSPNTHWILNLALDALTLIVGYTHVLLAPYTKVEESFNLHAVHDVLVYGVGREGVLNYDHLVHPSPVPRTFIGALVLGYTTKPFMPLLHFVEGLAFVLPSLGPTTTKLHLQILIRLILSTYSSISLVFIRRRFCASFSATSTAYIHLSSSSTLLLLSTFHLPFWSSRTLPNTYALVLTNIASGLLVSGWVSGRVAERTADTDDTDDSTKRPENILIACERASSDLRKALAILTFASVVFRAELAALLLPLVMQLLLTRRLSLLEVLKTGLTSGLLSLCFTLVVDSYFHPSTHFTYPSPLPGWPKGWVWPELMSVMFNVVEGKASEWGVSPWYTYVLSLPKLLLFAFPLSFVPVVLALRSIWDSGVDSKAKAKSIPNAKMEVDSTRTKTKSNSDTDIVASSKPGIDPKPGAPVQEANDSIFTSTNTTATSRSSQSEVVLETQARALLSLLVPYIAMLVLLSLLAHKEWRFIVYVIPMFIGAGAWGFVWMWEWCWTQRGKEKINDESNGLHGHVGVWKLWMGRLVVLAALVGGLCANVAVTTLLTSASRANYPGGEAMVRLRRLVSERAMGGEATVHISNLAAQTGASLFLELGSNSQLDSNGTSWVYDKTENLTNEELDERAFDYLISEVPPREGWSVVIGEEQGVVSAFDGWDVDLGGLKDAVRGVGRVLLRSGGDEHMGRLEGVLKELGRLCGVVRMKRRDVLWILERRVL